MYCKKCGHELKDTDKYCGRCGEPIKVTASSVPPAPESVESVFEDSQEETSFFQKYRYLIYFFVFIIGVVFYISNKGEESSYGQSSYLEENNSKERERAAKEITFKKYTGKWRCTLTEVDNYNISHYTGDIYVELRSDGSSKVSMYSNNGYGAVHKVFEKFYSSFDIMGDEIWLLNNGSTASQAVKLTMRNGTLYSSEGKSYVRESY